MKVAVAVENDKICGHFGHSPSFTFYEIEDGKVVSSKNIQSPGHGHGILPDFIAENGASAVIAGGMGEGAVKACASKGIEVIIGASGDPDDAVSLYAQGSLKSSDSLCGHHHEESHGSSCSHHNHSDHEHGSSCSHSHEEKGGNHQHGSCCHHGKEK